MINYDHSLSEFDEFMFENLSEFDSVYNTDLVLIDESVYTYFKNRKNTIIEYMITTAISGIAVGTFMLFGIEDEIITLSGGYLDENKIHAAVAILCELESSYQLNKHREDIDRICSNIKTVLENSTLLLNFAEYINFKIANNKNKNIISTSYMEEKKRELKEAINKLEKVDKKIESIKNNDTQ